MAIILVTLGMGWGMACGGRPPTATATVASTCPDSPQTVEISPGVRPDHRQVETWLAKLPPGAADTVLVSAETIDGLNMRASAVEGAWRDPMRSEVADPLRVKEQLQQRQDWIETQVNDGHLVEGQAGSVAKARKRSEQAESVDELRIAVEESSLWCIALDTGLYKLPIDLDFDRNRCSSVHPGERLRVLRRSLDGAWLYVHTGYAVGWLRRPVLTPPLDPEHLVGLWSGPRLAVLKDNVKTDTGRPLRLGITVPVAGREGDRRRIWIPTAQGLVEDTVTLSDAVHEGPPPLTRRRLWTMALSELDTPYGWGGRGGHRDCSRLTRDLFATFGIELARHSGVQAKLGTHNIDVSDKSEADKLAAVEHWAARGVVLLYMPGHIMMYLGADGGQHYAVSAISEYLEPCPGGPDTVFELGRVAVSTLELGRGSERTAYIERLSRLVVFAPEVG